MLKRGLVFRLATSERAQGRQMPCEIATPPAVSRRSHQAQTTVGELVFVTTKLYEKLHGGRAQTRGEFCKQTANAVGKSPIRANPTSLL